MAATTPSNDVSNEKVQNHTTSRFLRWLRFACSEYRLLFTIVFALNLVGVIVFLFNWVRRGHPNDKTCALATSINLAISIVIREEHVVNGLYAIATAVPSTAPLWFRRRVGKIYHLGGLHSGCAVAATFWFVLLSVESTISFCDKTSKSAERWILIIVIYILDCLLVSMVVMAHPSIRAKLHNAFEIVHRLAGWSSLALLWTLTVLDTDLRRSSNQTLSSALFGSANIWLLFIATFSIIITWLNCRKVKVESEQLSKHALRIKFDYATPSPGTTIRLSSSPLFEWHAFATWSQPGQRGFSLIISNAGDWTKALINSPPREIWARRTPTCGVLRIAPMFRSVLLVATGSGIAPCLPVIMSQSTRINLFWSTRDPLTTYGDEIGAIVTALGKNAYIHNTSTMGRPSTLPLVLQQYKDTDSEAVIVISNPKLTTKLVQDLEYMGIPAFGPIWDS
ncbi:Adenylate-forming reductase [Lachnellula arida]|uniref:Adenylate-forming reductase n=1 Tax=Lachnellula arida TaxID=1316785 RepID=A0A8T9B7W6_9HELO|nr:Adenylate-forming reductase [Lachnellula arida]